MASSSLFKTFHQFLSVLTFFYNIQSKTDTYIPTLVPINQKL